MDFPNIATRLVPNACGLRKIRATAHGGRVGVRGLWWAGWCPLSLGRRRAWWYILPALQYLAGSISGRQHWCWRVSHHRTGSVVRAERVWPLQYVRQCLGMDVRCVRGPFETKRSGRSNETLQW